jgi:hypothetical protein
MFQICMLMLKPKIKIIMHKASSQSLQFRIIGYLYISDEYMAFQPATPNSITYAKGHICSRSISRSILRGIVAIMEIANASRR